MQQTLTHERLTELLAYDSDSGVFTWRTKIARKIVVGSEAGCKRENDYSRIRLDGRLYLAHRLAWMYIYLSYPALEIDHIDGNKSNNAILNLRCVNKSVNMQNLKKHRADNASRFLGVSRDKRRPGRWFSQIVANGKHTWLGFFDTPEAAHAAYLDAKRRLHPGCTI